MSWLKRFFEEESGKPSSMRLYSIVALVVAVVLSFHTPINFGLVITWLIAAFAPKSIQKLAEKWTPDVGRK